MGLMRMIVGKMSKKPKAVLISDVHFNINTLWLASSALNTAVTMANDLGVHLVIAGDLHDTKANMRAECVNQIRSILMCATKKPYVLIGNHDLINEKSVSNALNFLRDSCVVVEHINYHSEIDLNFIPYLSDISYLDSYEFMNNLKVHTLSNTQVIMHQGIIGSNSGEYYQDKSAIPKEALANFRVISGHYHTRQDIKCGPIKDGNVGLASYIGNPYTLSFAEASDPVKGFQVLYDDGSLEFIPTNLRKHVVLEYAAPSMDSSLHQYFTQIKDEDLVWVKVTGTREDLSKITKQSMAKLIKRDDFKFDLIPTDNETNYQVSSSTENPSDVLDKLIDSTASSNDQKFRIKELYRQFISKD